MIRFLVDENVNAHVVHGVRRLFPDIDLVTADEAGLVGRPDPFVLAWAAEHDRVVLTHDVNTMIGFANNRILQGLEMPGVVQLRASATVKDAIEAIFLLDACSEHAECSDNIIFIPYPEAPRTL